MAFNERIIEVDVVCNKNIPLQTGENFLSNLLKLWRILNHLVIDTGKCLDVFGDVLIGVDECFKFFDDIFPIKNFDSDFNNAVCCCIAAGSFNIYNCIGHKERFETFQKFNTFKRLDLPLELFKPLILLNF